MLGRRKHQRYVLLEPVSGSLHLRDEVAIEAWGDGEVVVLSPEPLRPGDRLSLEVPGRSRHRIHVRVLESRPQVVPDSLLRHRLKLAIESPIAVRALSGVDES